MTDYNFKPKSSPTDFGWYGTNNLPHFDGDQVTQFVTFRLYDSLPTKMLDRLRSTSADDAEFRKQIERYLDGGNGNCWLRDPRIAEIVAKALTFNDGKRFLLSAWVIMPNHGHALLTQLPGIHLPDAMHSIKSFSAQAANKLLKRKGRFWQEESFDRYIRDYKHFAAVTRYIEMNPVNAGLCSTKEQWPWSSANPDWRKNSG